MAGLGVSSGHLREARRRQIAARQPDRAHDVDDGLDRARRHRGVLRHRRGGSGERGKFPSPQGGAYAGRAVVRSLRQSPLN